MKLTWAVAIALVVFLLLQPVSLFIASHLDATHFNLAADLTSLMGAIFTAGGLIVALVSLYTLANVDKAARKAVSDAVAKVTPRIDERIQIFLEAYSEFRSAQDLWGEWRYAALNDVEQRLDLAQQIEPTLRGVDLWAGEVFFTVAREMYFVSRRINASIGQPPLSELPMRTMKALTRLERVFATTKDEDEASSVGLKIAQLHAIGGDSPRSVAHWIARTAEHGPLASLDGMTALTLFGSCRRRKDVTSILSAYHLKALTPQDILSHCLAQPEPRQAARFVVFADVLDGLENRPANLTILDLRSVDNWSSAYAIWNAAEHRDADSIYGGLPVLAAPAEGENPPPRVRSYERFDSLVAQLTNTFTFIVPFS